MKKQQLLSLLLVIIMLAAILAGCQTSEVEVSQDPSSEPAVESSQPQIQETSQTEPETQAPEESDAESEEPDAEPEEQEPTAAPTTLEDILASVKTDFEYPYAEEQSLSIWYSYPPFIPQYYDSAADMPDFQVCLEKTNIALDFIECTQMQASEQFNLMIAADECTDLVFGFASYYTGSIETAVLDQIVQDLSPYLEDFAPYYTAFLKTNEEYSKEITTDGGYIPLFYGLNDAAATADINKSGPVVRGDWLEQLGMERPQTYDDYYALLQAMQSELGCEHPFWMPYTGAYRSGTFAAGFGTTALLGSSGFFQVDGQVKFNHLEDGYQEYITTMAKWYDEGLIKPDFYSYTQTDGNPQDSEISSDELGVWSSAANLMDYTSIKADKPEFFVVAATDAVKNVGDTTMFGDKTAALGASCAVSVNCDDIELALRWCDWWFTEDGYYTANYGIKGESYEIIDGEPKYTDVILNPSNGMTINVAQSCYTCGNGLQLCFQDPYRSYQWYSEEAEYAETLWATVSTNSAALGSITLTAEESEEFSNIMGDISTYESENQVQFITGGKSLDEFDDYIQGLYDLNIERAIEIYQGALDRYNNR